ncbi:hypothetical protein HN615_04675 [Candidatus Woesearchaeota archaeon]|jgi:hypothetical protein|nr:hypothetical protein [Candidatus Woesearchaeota archaeon]
MEEGKIKVRAIMEIMGSPEEHVSKTMNMVVEKLKNSDYFKCIEEKVSESTKIEDRPFWSKFVEAELEFDEVDMITGFCFDFMPSTLEVVEPSKINFERNILNNLWNDLIARLHQYDMLVKNLHAENVVMKREMAKLSVKAGQPKPTEAVVEKDEEKKE